MRSVRKLLDIALPVAGIVVILGAVLFVIELRTQVILVLVGILLIEAGTWNLATPLLPEDRKYMALRREADRFIGLVRRLNSAAVEAMERTGADDASTDAGVVRVTEEMHASVERMAGVAGRTDVEPEPGV